MWKHVQNSLSSYLLSKLDKQDTQNYNIACYIYKLHFGIHVNGKEEVAGSWRRLNNEELHNLYLSNVTGMKLRSVRWFGNGREVHIKFLWENKKGGDYLEDLGLEQRIILKWI